MKSKFEINQAANLADIGSMISEAIFAFDENTDSARDIIFDIHTLLYPNSVRSATPEELAAIAAQEPPAGTPCQYGESVIKKAQVEAKLLNLQSYARLIRCGLEDTATDGTSSYRVMSGDTWNDCFLMLRHIDETLTEFLPE